MLEMLVFIGFVAAVWLTVEIRSRIHPEAHLHRELVQNLKPFVAMPQRVRYMDKEELWRAIGGFRGVLCAFWAAGAIATLANRCRRDSETAQTVAREIFAGAMALRWLAALVLIEAAGCALVPSFPRPLTSALVHLYCELVCELDIAQAIAGLA